MCTRTNEIQLCRLKAKVKQVRLVTHLDVTRENIPRVMEAYKEFSQADPGQRAALAMDVVSLPPKIS